MKCMNGVCKFVLNWVFDFFSKSTDDWKCSKRICNRWTYTVGEDERTIASFEVKDSLSKKPYLEDSAYVSQERYYEVHVVDDYSAGDSERIWVNSGTMNL